MPLTDQLLDALKEVSGYAAARPFWWRQASMTKLAELGLVEAWHPGGKVTKRPAHRITEAGRALLASNES